MILKTSSSSVSAPFCKVSFQQINLNSHQQLKEFLYTQGWIPLSFTEKGSPQLTEDSYDSIKGELGQLIAKRAVLKHRAGMIFNVTKKGELKGLLNMVRADGRIEAGAETCGTNTGRMRHRGVVNIPSVGSIYGAEIRSLFTVPEGKILMGCDAAGLEARIMAHYLYSYPGGKEYAELLINGDIHQHNADIFETDRKGAKSPFYCLLYGGQVTKFAETLGCNQGKAKKLFDKFWAESKALAMFKKELTKPWKARGGKKGGYLRGLDGRKLYARSEHSLVNLMFQSAGSIVVKTATLFLDKWARQQDIDSCQVIHQHDEWQREAYLKDEETLTELMEKAFIKSGIYWKLNIPIVGEVKVGNNWRDTH